MAGIVNAELRALEKGIAESAQFPEGLDRAESPGGPELFRPVLLFDLGQADYGRTLQLQRDLQNLRIEGTIADSCILVEHPPTLTIGKAGGQEHILAGQEWLADQGFQVYQVERGGDVTYHGPGQIVGYPILDLTNYQKDVHLLVYNLEKVLIYTLSSFGITAKRRKGFPGVWAGQKKIASIGLGVKRWVTIHGFALNVNPNLSHFRTIVPCGLGGVEMTSMAELLGHPIRMQEVKSRIIEHMSAVFKWELRLAVPETDKLFIRHGLQAHSSRPEWLTVPAPSAGTIEKMEGILAKGRLHTVCAGACCPNAGECFALGTATFMILGDVCTRRCRFCAVGKGAPHRPEPGEAEALAQTVKELTLKHVVVTSVTRDDLPDGGAAQFAAVVSALRRLNPETTVELLVPDFGGSRQAIQKVVKARPDVYGHNMETVPRLYPQVRPGADYKRSLGMLAEVKRLAPEVKTKSGLMVGLGEDVKEVLAVMDDLRKAGCNYLTIGQYLQPTSEHLPVQGFISPAMFSWYWEQAIQRGFEKAECGPLVRSSYHAQP